MKLLNTNQQSPVLGDSSDQTGMGISPDTFSEGALKTQRKGLGTRLTQLQG